MSYCSVCHLPVAETIHRPGSSRSHGRACPFCSAVFSRVDGARRHAKICPQREGRTLENGRRGRKAQSCDQCSRVKVHCDARNKSSCERCVSRKLECTFSRCCTDATHHQSVQEAVSDLEDRGLGRLSLSYLLNITDDKQDFVTERVVGEEPDGPLLGPACDTPSGTETYISAIFDYIDPALLLPSDPETCVVPAELGGLYSIEEHNLLGALNSPQSQGDRLLARLNLLERDLAAHASSQSSLNNSFDPAGFRHFFDPSNVYTFATIFCRKRHYRYQVIHWPTFSLEEASLPLLMVVALTGATYSYQPGCGTEHIVNARKLYHLADSYVFHQLELYLDNQPSNSNLSEAIQLCQAALLMFGLDTLLASDLAMRHAARTKRLPELISAMRRLDFIGCRHSPCEDWQLFLQREKIIRLLCWTFGDDCLSTFSYNNPPIFSLLEMSGDFPCHPELWEADSASAFELLKSSQQSVSHNLRDLMSSFLHDDWQMNDDWEELPLFHLHVILCAFQPVIFNLHVAMSLPQQSNKLLQRLATWRRLWRVAMEKIPEGHRQWLGVSKYVPPIEYLTRRIIEVAVSPEANLSRYLQRVPAYDAREIHEFIRDFITET